MKAMFSCDWLELYCESNQPIQCGSVRAGSLFMSISQREYGTRVYRYIYDVELWHEEDFVPFLTICCCPLSPILKPTDAHVKLANYWLYTDMWLNKLEHALRAFCINPIQPSRIDLCADWQYCRSGIAAWDLLNGLVCSRFLKVHQPHWRLHAYDSTKAGRLYYNSLAFGSKSSSVFTRFYNKSLELRQGSDKVYIRERWSQIGFDDAQPIFRTEFSLQSLGRKSVDRETGAIVEIDWRRLIDHSYLSEQFRYYAAYYFDIRRADNARRDRCTPLDIFGGSDMSYAAFQNPRFELSTRTDRLVLNYLHKNYGRLAVTPEQMRSVTQAFASIMYSKRTSASSGMIQQVALRYVVRDILVSVDDMVATMAWVDVIDFGLPTALPIAEVREVAEQCDLRCAWEFYDYSSHIQFRCYSNLVK